MTPPVEASAEISRLIRGDWGRILSALVRNLGDISLAEDCLQDAVLVALDRWSQDGMPRIPDAWLSAVARRKALDRLRRENRFVQKSEEIAYLQELERSDEGSEVAGVIADHRLELIFACCHPALELKSRVALTLRALGGLTTVEIAAAFLDKPDAMAARLTRAKRKISDAGIPFRVPEGPDLAERVEGVLQVIYLIFNEGYRASGADELIRRELIDEAVRLARVMVALMPEQRECRGLLALMVLHDARSAARLDEAGDVIPLQDQDRGLWDADKIAEGRALVVQALGRDAGPYGVQAAISALHAEAPSFEKTDWAQIAALYAVLQSKDANPVVEINRAVAVSFAEGPEAALDILNAVGDGAKFSRYQPFFAARADVFARLGRVSSARKDYHAAIALSGSEAERRFLRGRMAQLPD